jgi:hypothetical protein
MTDHADRRGSVSRRAFLKLSALLVGGTAFILNDLKPGRTNLQSLRASPKPGAAKKVATKPPPPKPAPPKPAPPKPAPPKPAPTPARTLEAEYPVVPYISKEIHLDALPWGRQSFYRQPWRGYLETVPGEQFLSGIGINYNLPDGTNHEAVIKLLSECGFKSIRVEVGWNSVDWGETALTNAPSLPQIFAACARHGVTPLILLNAHQGGPCPSKGYTRTVLEGGATGSRRLRLDTVAELVPGYSGISNLTDYWMAEALFTSVDPLTNTVQLSKPLPKAFAPGSQVPVHTLKYLPLYGAGTPQFDQTAAGWLKYVKLIMEQVRASGLGGIEVEVWNELTFGSQFLMINNYYNPPLDSADPNIFLRKGSRTWELAHRTIDFVHTNYPGTRVIWGFSNTTFFAAAVPELPAGTDGQSYHPYGTQKRLIPGDFPPKDHYRFYMEGFIPRNLSWCMPEGWAHLGVQMEYLMRLLNPGTRLTNVPSGTKQFRHYMTEHGFDPSGAGIADRNQALAYKAKSAVRALLFWLNKGITRMEVYAGHSENDVGMGMLYANYAQQQLMSPALQAVRNVVRQFAGAQPLGRVRQLDVEVTSLGNQYKVFDGDASHPPLYYREMLTFLPYQVNPHKFVCAVYVMSYDITNPPPPMRFRLKVKNVNGSSARVSFYDPITNAMQPVEETSRDGNQITVTIPAVEYPRLLIIQE